MVRRRTFKKHPQNSEVCEKNGCNRKAVVTCKYCHKEFCGHHITARVSTSATVFWNMNRSSDPEKFDKYKHDWVSESGHGCSEYTTWWNKNHTVEQEAKMDDTKKSWKDSLSSFIEKPSSIIVNARLSKEEIEKSREKLGIEIEDNPSGGNDNNMPNSKKDKDVPNNSNSSERVEKSNSKSVEKSALQNIDPILLIESILMAIAISVLSLPEIGFIKSVSSQSFFTVLASMGLLLNFVIIFVVILLYDLITTRKIFIYQEVLGGCFAALVFTITSPAQQSFSIITFILVIISIYIGFFAGKKLKDKLTEVHHIRLADGVIAFLLILWIGYIIMTYTTAYMLTLPKTTTTTSATTTILVPQRSNFYTVMGYKNNNLIFLTCQGRLCNLSNLNKTLQVQAGLIPSYGTGSVQLALQPPLLKNVFGFGLNGSSSLNTSVIANGSLSKIFHTPVQLLIFNEKLSSIQVSGGVTGSYYNTTNGTIIVSLNETILQTSQASYIFVKQAQTTPNIGVIGTTGGLQYFINSTLENG